MARSYNIHIPVDWKREPMGAFTVKREAQAFIVNYNLHTLGKLPIYEVITTRDGGDGPGGFRIRTVEEFLK